jgi:orotidine-5'-phosphate decarboxylase
VSIHVDDEFSLRIALESELDDVRPDAGLAGLVIARHHRSRRRRVAGAVSLVVLCAGIGVPLGLSGPSSKSSEHHPGQRPDQHTGSVTLITPPRTANALVIGRPVFAAAAA